MERELLTTPEARRLSGLSLTHLAALAREGKIEAKRYGRDWMIFKDSLDAYLTKERKPGPKGPRKQKAEQA